MLRVLLRELLIANPNHIPFFCRYNSGAPRTSRGRKSPRGPETFTLAPRWSAPASRVAEVSFVGTVILPATTEFWDEEAGGWKPLPLA